MELEGITPPPPPECSLYNHLFIYLFIHQTFHWSIRFSTCVFNHPLFNPSIHSSIYQPSIHSFINHISFHSSTIYPFIYLSIHLSTIYPFIYLSVYSLVHWFLPSLVEAIGPQCLFSDGTDLRQIMAKKDVSILPTCTLSVVLSITTCVLYVPNITI